MRCVVFGLWGGLRLVGGMALFRLEAKIFSRAKCGRSVIAAAAYRAGTKLRDELTDRLAAVNAELLRLEKVTT